MDLPNKAELMALSLEELGGALGDVRFGRGCHFDDVVSASAMRLHLCCGTRTTVDLLLSQLLRSPASVLQHTTQEAGDGSSRNAEQVFSKSDIDGGKLARYCRLLKRLHLTPVCTEKNESYIKVRAGRSSR